MRVDTIDLLYLGLPQAAAAFLLRRDDGRSPGRATMIECGPAACVARLDSEVRSLGVDAAQIDRVLLTHIHLDHAGAAGYFAARGTRIAVHPIGAPHLIDPAKLIASSRRVHGPAFDRFYGEPLPIAPERIEAVADGGTVDLDGAIATAIETPGHARHHHAWLIDDGDRRRLFAGDVAAMLVPNSTSVSDRMPHDPSPAPRMVSVPTPPPEFDFDAWRASLARLRAVGADELWLTHFGRVQHRSVQGFLDEVEARLVAEVTFMVALLDACVDEPSAIEQYQSFLAALAREHGIDEGARAAFLGASLCRMNLAGVRRWRERREA